MGLGFEPRSSDSEVCFVFVFALGRHVGSSVPLMRIKPMLLALENLSLNPQSLRVCLFPLKQATSLASYLHDQANHTAVQPHFFSCKMGRGGRGHLPLRRCLTYSSMQALGKLSTKCWLIVMYNIPTTVLGQNNLAKTHIKFYCPED